MKKIIACVTLVFILAFGIYALTCIEKVEAGYVGVKVNLLGSSKGVDTEKLGVGRYWVGINEQLFTFSTAQQTKEWRGNDQKGEKFVDWKLDPHARDHLKRGYNFLLSYEEIDYLEEMFNRKMKELGL